jgi:hypothetical protein
MRSGTEPLFGELAEGKPQFKFDEVCTPIVIGVRRAGECRRLTIISRLCLLILPAKAKRINFANQAKACQDIFD